MYLEGSDQHRGWFQSSLLTSMGAYGVPPYKAVMHCGFTVDGEGRKMSKSLGNGVDPAEVMEKSGADVLRLWVASVDYSQDVSISDEILQRTSEAYRRIRNTFRFLLGSLDDFDDQKDAVSDWNALEPLDQWAMVRTKHLLDDVSAAYDAYKFHYVYRAVYDYIVNDLSAVYMDATKDRLYSEAPDSPRRRAVQTVLMNILEVLVRVLAPVLSFTTDEVWEHYPQAMRERAGRPTNVQLAGWPKASDFAPAIPADGERVSEDFGVIMGVREVVRQGARGRARSEGREQSRQAAVVVTAPRAVLDAVERYDAAVFEAVHRGVRVVRRRRGAGGDGFEDRGREMPALLEPPCARRQREPRIRLRALRRCARRHRLRGRGIGSWIRNRPTSSPPRVVPNDRSGSMESMRPRPKAFRPFRTSEAIRRKPPFRRKKPGN